MNFIKEVIDHHKIELGTQNILSPYTIDILTDKMGFEINGPWHYLRNKEGISVSNGVNELKLRFFKKLNLTVVDIPYFEVTGDHEQDLKLLKYKISNTK